jgi:hypothetical protein
LVALDNGGATVGVRAAKIDLEKLDQRKQRLPFGVAYVIVQGEDIAAGAKILGKLDDLWSGIDVLEDFDDNAVARQ